MESSRPLATGDETATADGSGIAEQARPRESLAAEVRRRSGVNPTRCYQCGKCSAGCPMASEMTIRTHEVMHHVLRNKRDRLLDSDGIWLCLTCETCSARCPTGADPARVIDTLREMAVEQDPTLAPRSIGAFNRSFLDQIKLSGRMSEVGLAVQYNLRSGHVLQDATSMASLFTRGKLKVNPPGVRNVGEVRRIFRNVEAVQRKARGQGGGR